MSRIGKKIIEVPEGVEIKIEDSVVRSKGPKGELTVNVPKNVLVSFEDGKITVSLSRDKKEFYKFWGLTRALIANAVTGVSTGFEKVLEFDGVGYRASVKGNDLELNLGFSHPISVPAPEGITFNTEKNTIKVSGASKQEVGQVAARIRSLRKPEPYKGHGIRYQGERIIRKAGKKAAGVAA